MSYDLSSSSDSSSDDESKNPKSNKKSKIANSSSGSDSTSDFDFKIKTRSQSKLKSVLKSESSYSQLESESDSVPIKPLNLGPDTTSSSVTESEVENENNLESSSESTVDPNLGPYPFKSEFNEKIEKIIGINQPTFSEPTSEIMYYVKYKDQSYRCSKWISEEEIFKTVQGKILHSRFIKNPTPFKKVHFFNATTEYYQEMYELFKPVKIKFDEGFLIPEKVLSIQSNLVNQIYLVKWTSLDITESTWETEIPSNLIDEYESNNSITHPPIYDHSENQDDQNQFNQIEKSPKFKNHNKLTSPQVNVLNWLQNCWIQEKSSILVEEKGLGRTIESLSILDRLSKMYLSWGPFLIVCPSSSVNCWMNEIEMWTNLRAVPLIGHKESAKYTKKYLMYHHIDEENKLDKSQIIFDILIVSYESLPRDITFVNKFNFMYAIFDDAQRIKNSESNIYQDCMSIRSHQKLLLIENIFQNDLFEIWSLFKFVHGSEFPDFTQFEESCNNEDEIDSIKDLIRPYIFRKIEGEISDESTEKDCIDETIVEVEMTQIQRNNIKKVIEKNLNTLSDISASKVKLNSIMNHLYKLFCHPFLFTDLESFCISQYKEMNQIPKSAKLNEEDEITSMIYSSGKTVLIDKLLPKLKDENHKVLIFSQIPKMLDIIENYLIYKEYLYERLDGSYSPSKRSLSIEKFQNDEIFVLLLSPESGGIGIDATGADTVIIYDGNFDIKNDYLYQSKFHDENQQKSVNIFRLITRGCYESEMFLNDFQNMNFDPNPTETLSLFDETENMNLNNEEKISEIRNILQTVIRKTTLHIFNDDSNEIDNFCNESIEQILESRSHTRKEIEEIEEGQINEIENSQIQRNDFWNNLSNSQSETETDDFDFNSGIKPRQIKKQRKRDIDDYEYDESNQEEENENEKENESSSSESSNFQPTTEDEDEVVVASVPDYYDDIGNEQNYNKKSSTQKIVSVPSMMTKLKDFVSPYLNASQPELYTISFLNSKIDPNQKQSRSFHSNDSIDELENLSDVISSFTDSLAMKICKDALDVVRKHGIACSRLYTSKTKQEIGKSLIILASLRISKENLNKFSIYIHQHVLNFESQLLKTPFKEFNDDDFLSSLFKDEELQIIEDAFYCDKIYKIANFVSIEKLPIEFQFAPEMSTPLGWTPIEDFILITAAPLFMNKINEMIEDEKLPFKKFSEKFNFFNDWFVDRFNLILNELELIVPQDYTTYEYNKDNELVPKKFGDVKNFTILNNHVINPKRLTVNMQKKLLRIFYLYGIPRKNGIGKIKEILKFKALNADELILNFTLKFLIEAIKFEPGLCELLKLLMKKNSFINNKYVDSDIKWINNNVIQAVASNLILIFKVREFFDQKVKLNGLPKCDWWDLKNDKILFESVATYGFLFNSMLCKFIPSKNVSQEKMLMWRNEEIENLQPLTNQEMEYLGNLLSFDMKKERITQIIDFLSKKEEGYESDTD